MIKTEAAKVPASAPTLRTVPQPSDLNVNGNIFGGWVLSQMDIGGAIEAARVAHGPVATVAIDSMNFLNPIEPGDVVSVYTEIYRLGTTSVTVDINVFKEGPAYPEPVIVTRGRFIFVALDENGRPRPIKAKD